MVDDLKAQVDTILNVSNTPFIGMLEKRIHFQAPSSDDIISAAVKAVLGNSTNQTQARNALEANKFIKNENDKRDINFIWVEMSFKSSI